MNLRLVRLPAAVVVLLALVPAAAHAENVYTVASCHDPKPNPAAGWVAFATGQGKTANTCSANGALSAVLDADAPAANSSAGWRFTAPAGTHIVRVRAARTTQGFSGAARTQEYDSAYSIQTPGNQTLEKCEMSYSSPCVADLTAPLDKQGLIAPYVEMQVLCTNGGQPCSRRVSVDAPAVNVSLADPVAPTVANARVFDSGETSGTLRVGFDAADVGSGVYRAIVKVDGKIAKAIALGLAPCRDVVPGDNPYEFNVPTPCPAAVTGAIAMVDVSSLPPGPHGVEVAVEDAAGNQTAVAGPIEFPKSNVASDSPAERAAALTGKLRMWFVEAKSGDRRRYTSRYGNRVVTRGTLRSRSGTGIVGARIDVYHIRRDGSRKLLVKTGLKSRARGRLTLILPNNVDTRTIEFAYRALRPGVITSRQRLRLTVRTASGRTYYRKSSGQKR